MASYTFTGIRSVRNERAKMTRGKQAERDILRARTEYQAMTLKHMRKGTRPVNRKLMQTAMISDKRDCFDPPFSDIK